MRPHVELIDEKDLIWHMAEFPHGVGEARQRNLNYCEELGEASLSVEFTSNWSRVSGVHNAQTEWYVLAGEVTIGDKTLVAGDYWIANVGICVPAMTAKAGTKTLLFREFGDWGFTPGTSNTAAAKPGRELVVMQSSKMPWYDIMDPTNGSPMNFEAGGVPVPGLYIKLLYKDPDTGFYTRLIKAKANWHEHPLAHHPCYEEAYCLEGSFSYNYGPMWPGTYFFRPALVRHGDFTSGPEGTTWILRCDGRLVDWYTDNARVEMHGDATNWGPGYPGTQEPVLLQPTRSRSIGKMADPAYL